MEQTIKLDWQLTGCITCGSQHFVERNFYDFAVGNNRTIYCPTGHANVFTGETNVAKVERLEGSNKMFGHQNDRLLTRLGELEERVAKRNTTIRELKQWVPKDLEIPTRSTKKKRK